MNFKVLQEDIYFSEEFIKLNELRVEFLNLALDSFDFLKDEYFKTIKTKEELETNGILFGEKFIETYILKAVEIINSYNVDNIDKETFIKEFYNSNYYQWNQAVEEIISSANKTLEDIITNKDVIQEDLNISINLNSELIKNSFNEKLQKILKSEEVKANEFYEYTLSNLFNSMCESVFNIHLAIIDVLKSNNIEEILDYKELDSNEKTDKILNDLLSSNDIGDSEALAIKEVISLNPYNEEIYKLLINNYGDKKNEIQNLGEFLGYNNIRGYKESLLSEYYNTLSLKSKDEALLAKEALVEFANRLNIEDYVYYLSEIEGIIADYNNEAAITDEEEKGNEVKVEKRKSNKESKLPVILISIGLALVAIYFIMAVYFNSHFFLGTSINGIGVSGKGIKATNDYIASLSGDFIIELKERGNITEELKGNEFNLKYDFYDKINELIKDQNPFLWVTSLFSKTDYEIKDNITYDELLLKQAVGNLDCLKADNIEEPVNAYISYSNGQYEIVDEILGSKINTDKFYEAIIDSINHINKELDLEAEGCYEDPSYKADSAEVINAKDTANSYLKAKVTYNVNDGQEIVNSDLISNWIVIDEEFNVEFSEEAVGEYVEELGSKYDYLGNYRDLIRPNGDIIKVSTSPGIYYVDRTTEKEALIEAIKSGNEVTKDLTLVTPIDSDTYAVNTFVEVNLTNQYVTFYKNGELLTEGSCVTGSVAAGHATPAGVFRLDWKRKDFVLRGEDYASPVSFWMPFNGGIGLHDASWRSSFGGQIYQTNGSHGCVNLPYSVAETIYYNLGESAVIIVTY